MITLLLASFCCAAFAIENPQQDNQKTPGYYKAASDEIQKEISRERYDQKGYH